MMRGRRHEGQGRGGRGGVVTGVKRGVVERLNTPDANFPSSSDCII